MIDDHCLNSKRERLSHMIKAAKSCLEERKARKTLVSGIQKMTLETSFLEEKVSMGKRDLQRIRKNILDAEVVNERKIVDELTRQLSFLKKEYEEKGNQKKLLSETNHIQKEHIERLLAEISVFENMREVLSGMMPKDNPDDFERHFEQYVDEMEDRITQIKKQNDALCESLRRGRTEENILSGEKAELEERIVHLLSKVNTSEDRDLLLKHVEALVSEKNRYQAWIESGRKDMLQLEDEIEALEKDLKNGMITRDELNNRLNDLASLEKELKAKGDVEKEVRRLKEEIRHIRQEQAVCEHLLKIVAMVNAELSADS